MSTPDSSNNYQPVSRNKITDKLLSRFLTRSNYDALLKSTAPSLFSSGAAQKDSCNVKIQDTICTRTEFDTVHCKIDYSCEKSKMQNSGIKIRQ